MPSLTDGAAAGTWRGETDASGLHGVDVAVGLAWMLFPGVPLGRPKTTERDTWEQHLGQTDNNIPSV